MRISIIGDGRMGQAVVDLAQRKGITVLKVLNREQNRPREGFSGDWIEESDALIDFSVASAVPGNVESALRVRVPIVIGVTGWDESLPSVRKSVEAAGGAVLHGSNFSLGMQVLFALTRSAARLFSQFEDYDPFIWEAHHKRKADRPSGTALTLQEIIRREWGKPVAAASIRAGAFPGTHVVGFDSEFDTLELKHTARNREGFARGALAAAHWIQNKRGFFTIEDLIEETLNG